MPEVANTQNAVFTPGEYRLLPCSTNPETYGYDLIRKNFGEVDKIYPDSSLSDIVQGTFKIGEEAYSKVVKSMEIDSDNHLLDIIYLTNHLISREYNFPHAREILENATAAHNNECFDCNTIVLHYLLANVYWNTRNQYYAYVYNEHAIRCYEQYQCQNLSALSALYAQKELILRTFDAYEEEEALLQQWLYHPTLSCEDVELHYQNYLRNILAQQRLSDFPEAIADATDVLSDTPVKSINIDLLWGNYFWKLGKIEKAIHYFEKCLNDLDEALYVNPNWVDEAHYMLSILYPRVGHHNLAIDKLFDIHAIFTDQEKGGHTLDQLLGDVGMYEDHRIIPLLGNLSKTYYSKYVSSGDLQNLEFAIRTFSVMDSILFKANKDVEQDVILQFSSLIGRDYKVSVDALFDYYSETCDVLLFPLLSRFIDAPKAMYLTLMNYHGALHAENIKQVQKDLNIAKNVAFDNNFNMAFQATHESVSLIGDLNELIDEINKVSTKFYSTLLTPSLERLQQFSTQSKTTIVQLLTTDRYIYSFVIDAGEVFVTRTLLVDNLMDRLRQLKSHKVHPNLRDDAYLSLLDGLSADIVQPWLSKVSYENIIIIPDDILSVVPFSALFYKPISLVQGIDYGDLPFMLKHYVISVLPTAKMIDLDNLTQPKSSYQRVLAFSFSVIDYKKFEYNGGLSPLFFGAREVEMIRSTFKRNGRFFFGRNANKSNFLKFANDNYDVIHMATHGHADDKKRFGSSLFLRQGKSAEQLYYSDIAVTDIQAPLIVLPTCNSSVGLTYEGEGEINMVHAFFTNDKVKSVIASLWEVNDEVSSKIFGEFYIHLTEGKYPAQALRLAQLNYLKSARQTYSTHPALWANLICYSTN